MKAGLVMVYTITSLFQLMSDGCWHDNAMSVSADALISDWGGGGRLVIVSISVSAHTIDE